MVACITLSMAASRLAAPRLAAQVLQVLQPLTALLIVATQLSHTLFSFHPPLMAIAFILFIGQGVLTSLAARGHEGEKRGQLLQRHAIWYGFLHLSLRLCLESLGG